MDLKEKYHGKFNSKNKVKVDASWDRYYNNEEAISYKRYKYSVSHLFGSVLDVGSADGFGAFLMTKNEKISDVVGIEIQEDAINKSLENLGGIKNVRIVKGYAEKMDFDDNSFDSVHCGQTLEHVFDDELCVKEIHRVVKDTAVFSIPIMGGISLMHVREYKTIQEFKDLIIPYFTIVEEKIFVDEKGQQRVVLVTRK